jgi:hypothetical protein
LPTKDHCLSALVGRTGSEEWSARSSFLTPEAEWIVKQKEAKLQLKMPEKQKGNLRPIKE